eukprot:NODE_910_length_1241_cov_107.260906_g678_i0.p1 GENE.NODE_910_length_1241_cov_107.260906_g678_i0~~NODE_910_length_1241_cov_107.260906_g678_i0.p1  ORF type:complete len:324 (+),score=25.00 NODE_910_length_1241_cov_107.260906_g678_i0:22-972(+)
MANATPPPSVATDMVPVEVGSPTPLVIQTPESWGNHCCSTHTLTYEEIDEYLREPYVFYGYRPNNASCAEITKSVCKLHNETWNIWTHLFGLGLFSYLLVACALMKPKPDVHPRSKIALYGLLLSLIVCMICSSVFHWYLIRSKRWWHALHALDWSAIPLVIGCSTIALVWYLYPDESATARLLFVIIAGVLGFLGFISAHIPHFQQARYRTVHASLFVGIGLSSILPLATLAIMHGIPYPSLLSSLARLSGVAVSYLGGSALYISRVPERCMKPETFARCHTGYSHNWHHIGVLMGGLLTYLEVARLWRDPPPAY